MSKYKDGDKVWVLNGREIPNANAKWVPQMDKYIGGIYAIDCYEDGDYRLEGIPYWFGEDWLKPVGIEAMPNPKRIIRNGRAMVVFWNDGTKTIVKRAEDEPDNNYAAFTAALAIKIFGNNSAVRRAVSKTEVQEKRQKK